MKPQKRKPRNQPVPDSIADMALPEPPPEEVRDAKHVKGDAKVHGDLRARSAARPGPVPGPDTGATARVRVDPRGGTPGAGGEKAPDPPPAPPAVARRRLRDLAPPLPRTADVLEPLAEDVSAPASILDWPPSALAEFSDAEILLLASICGTFTAHDLQEPTAMRLYQESLRALQVRSLDPLQFSVALATRARQALLAAHAAEQARNGRPTS